MVSKDRQPADKTAAARITIQDVAAAAGVSTGTVSRVLNERPGVKPGTRERVLQTIASLDYRPDHAARALSRQPLRVGLSVSPGTRRLTPFFMLFLEHLISELQQDGFQLEEVPARPDGLPQWLSDGMILHGAHDDDPRLEFLQRQGVPFVLIGRSEGVRWVRPDDHDGGLQATRHLLNLGHRQIVYLGGLMSHQAFHDRYQGYQAAFSQAGLNPERSWLLDGDFTTLGAYRALRRAHAEGLRFSAIFAASDEMALGAIAALEDLGLNVPLDDYVVGFDDLPEIGSTLTTVRQEIGRIASTAVTLLREGLRGAPVRHLTIPVQLVARGTTARRREQIWDS
jgi:LacI family transcriptional regulator